MCLLYVSLESRVSPSIFGLMFMRSVMLSICSSSDPIVFQKVCDPSVYLGVPSICLICVFV